MQQEPLYISCKLSFTNCGHSESEHKKVTGYKNEEAEICGHLFVYEIYCIIPQKQATFKRPFFTTRDVSKHGLDHQPLFGKGSRAPPRRHGWTFEGFFC